MMDIFERDRFGRYDVECALLTSYVSYACQIWSVSIYSCFVEARVLGML